MKIRFHGAARTVTGSMHLLETNGHRVLLDTGLYQGRRQEAYERNRSFPFNAADISAVVLSHAHIDHSGNLPNLVRSGFRGKIFATPATRDLCALMLADSARIQQKDAEYLRKEGRDVVEPLYGEADAAAAMQLFETAPKGRPFSVVPGVQAAYHEAGHMLGSCGVLVEASEGGRTVRIGFSGDVGHAGDPLLPLARAVPDPEVLLLESTYGDRLHPPGDERKDTLLKIVLRTAQEGGRLIVPAFSVGRTQLLVYTLNDLFNEGRLPAMPIFVDSPLSVNATAVFRAHAEEMEPGIRAHLQQAGDADPFGFARLTYTRSVEESKALNHRAGPFMVISASGMCESGRIVHHLHNALGDPRNTILIVGFQAPHTLGARLVERAPLVRVLGQEVVVKARIEVLHGFSAHADQAGLVAYAKACNANGRLRRIFLVHGEERPMGVLGGLLQREGLPAPHAPARGEAFDL